MPQYQATYLNMPQYQAHIFVSFSHDDQNIINELIEILKINFGLNIWKNSEENVSKNLSKANKGIAASKLTLCCISKSYLKSEACCNQIKLAHTFNKETIFVMLEDVSLNERFDEVYYKGRIVNKIFKNSYKQSLWMGYQFEKLLEYISYALDLNLVTSLNDKSRNR
jgi:hypothetical protein